MELAKTYDPKSTEQKWFQLWIDLGYFKADPARKGTRHDAHGNDYFSIVIPPPNVTGQLHLGHALNHTLQDIIVRARRMQGFNTLWLPGMDHAGIATQNVVERQLAKDGKTRYQLGRESFVRRVWEWQETYGGKILEQDRRLGASLDWSRERFTLDAGLSRAVTKVFVELYRKGLIYRDRRLINWCPRCETALSDLEVEHKDAQGNLYYLRYPFSDGTGTITLATTRPETMLGDTAVAVHPDDQRYAAIVGKKLRLPFINREIPIIADAAVDPKFGTGAVKITPAHDFNDFEIGRRHHLEQVSVMDTRAHMNENAGPYRGLDREECRRRITDDLKSAGLLEKIEPHQLSVGTCSRCDTVVEPMISEQWFMRVKEMAERAMQAVRDGRTTFHPKFWENTFFNWLENIHDWCISRQLWWGHRIPAYRCQRCDHLMIAEERPARCEECGGNDITQDEDVLDTWFSSGLWPFSTLGWPEETPELRRYYPTSLLVTAYDIIFFWVARMMMLGLEFMNDVPFRDILITPLVRDEYGKKMTKSKGNVVDPVDLMEQYGTDACRLTFAQLSAQGREVILSHDRFAASRAFANKIWNAARFVMMNLDGAPQPLKTVEVKNLGLAERWILSRLDATIAEVSGAIDRFEFNLAGMAIYQFIWHEFCDWYIELSKEPLKAGGERRDAARYVLVTVFDRMLRLLHPFMPFISEEIWQVIRPYLREEDGSSLSPHLVIAKWPEPASVDPLSMAEAAAMTRCIEATEAINSLRSLLGYHPGQRVMAALRLVAKGEADSHSNVPQLLGRALAGSAELAIRAAFAQAKPYAAQMAKTESLEVLGAGAKMPDRVVTSVLDWCEVIVTAPEGFDFEKARGALQKKLDEVSTHHEQHLKRLGNPEFVAKAAPEMQNQIQERAQELEGQRRLLADQLKQLQASG
ncbi:MAG TPA: valine--tRNA ligase [Candidatus Binataceae bacterium]